MPVFNLPPQYIFPHPSYSEEDGLLAMGGDLEPNRIIEAYKNGIFPWYNRKPILWWSPNPRCILFPNQLKISKSLKQSIRSNKFEIRSDTVFKEVITQCAKVKRKGENGTWITKDMINAYCKIHELGFVHSIEAFKENKLVGGLYGLSLGSAFFGESMFHHVPDASKVALFYLVQFAIKNGFDFIDTQVTNKHLLSLGAKEIPRETFLTMLNDALKKETIKGKWKIHHK